MTKVPAVVLLAALCVPALIGQQRAMVAGSHAPSPAGHNGFAPAPRRSTTIFVGNGVQHRPFRRNRGLYGWPYFADYGFDADSYEYPQPAPAPQPAAQTAPAVPESRAPLPSPVLLELHGDQWVQVNNFATASSQPRHMLPDTETPMKELPPAILVYRDGHTEEINSYSIIGPVIYTKADYWTSGSWTRKIQIADLDLPATFKQNQDRGVKFDLPSNPDEVMIRP